MGRRRSDLWILNTEIATLTLPKGSLWEMTRSFAMTDFFTVLQFLFITGFL